MFFCSQQPLSSISVRKVESFPRGYMDFSTKIIPFELSDGTLIRMEVEQVGEQRVSFQGKRFEDFTKSVKSITNEIATSLREINTEVQPDRLSVKLGVEVAIESGQMTALIVKGASKANLEISMEWENR